MRVGVVTAVRGRDERRPLLPGRGDAEVVVVGEFDLWEAVIAGREREQRVVGRVPVEQVADRFLARRVGPALTTSTTVPNASPWRTGCSGVGLPEGGSPVAVSVSIPAGSWSSLGGPPTTLYTAAPVSPTAPAAAPRRRNCRRFIYRGEPPWRRCYVRHIGQ